MLIFVSAFGFLGNSGWSYNYNNYWRRSAWNTWEMVLGRLQRVFIGTLLSFCKIFLQVLQMTPAYMRFLSFGLLAPVEHSQVLRLNPSFCPSFFDPSVPTSDLERRYQTSLIIRAAVGSKGSIVYQHPDSLTYYKIGYCTLIFMWFLLINRL